MLIDLFCNCRCFVYANDQDLYVVVIHKKVIVYSGFISDDEGRLEFETLLYKIRKRITINFMIDIYDVDYVNTEVPNASSVASKMIAERLKTLLPNAQYKGAIMYSGDKKARYKQYVLVGLNLCGITSKYMQYCHNLPYLIQGVYMTGVESLNVLSVLHDLLYKNDRKSLSKHKHLIEIVVLHGASMGFRITISYNGHFMFYRMMNLRTIEEVESEAHAIEDLIKDSVGYANKVTRAINSTVHIYYIASTEMLESIKGLTIECNEVFYVNAQMLSKKLNIQAVESCKDSLQYAESYLSYICLDREILHFDDADIRGVVRWFSFAQVAKYMSYLLIVFSCIYTAVMGYRIYASTATLRALHADGYKVMRALSARVEATKYSEASAKDAYKLSAYNKMLGRGTVAPRDYSDLLHSFDDGEFDISRIYFRHMSEKQYSIKVSLVMYAAQDIEDSRKNYTEYKNRLQEVFGGCHIHESKDPVSIMQTSKQIYVPFEITISGKCYAN